MAVRFKFPGLAQEIEVRQFILLSGSSFERRRESLFFIYAIFDLINNIKERRIGFISNICRCEGGSIRVRSDDLADTLQDMYYQHVNELAREKLGYVPVDLPRLKLIPEGVESIEVEIVPGKGRIMLLLGNKKKISSEFEFFGKEPRSPEELLTDEIDWIFGKVFLGGESFRIGTPVYIPAERKNFETVHAQTDVTARASIREVMENIKEQVIPCHAYQYGLINDYVERMVVPVNFTETLIKKKVELSENDILSVLLSPSEEHPAGGHFKDLFYLYKARALKVGSGPFFIEELDVSWSEDYRLLFKLFLEDLIDDGYIILASTPQRALQNTIEILGLDGTNYGIYNI